MFDNWKGAPKGSRKKNQGMAADAITSYVMLGGGGEASTRRHQSLSKKKEEGRERRGERDAQPK